MTGFLQSLAYRFGVNIICYDYSGYGVSAGRRLEENLYTDVEAVLKELLERYQVPLEQIVLHGQSIGTAPTVDLATKYKVAGVVLHSTFMSGFRVVDEEGATAAAATAVMMNMRCAMRSPVVRVDHPFFVALTCASTVPVFIGHVTHPESN
ncbi:hypothetical protein EG68_04007 [Paragonimus skrjabini miyazakii]|uniref:Serpin domain-containing protein n=1 Tax=Paragonimus skrjabini miyazakii TaxID=59628 RepID=A0A8S9Z4M4_9TREM|nr:hypothetical protein EG68_04007 [Paragonimus skrjabini miyazakii]